MSEHSAKPGVKTKLFGVIVLFVAVLDAMLSWRGGVAVDTFYLVLFAAGFFLYAVGSIRQSASKD